MNIDKKHSVLIIGNGEPPAAGLLQDLVSKADCIIAADGGINICHENGINPHFIVGDLDSADPELLAAYPDAGIIRMPDQERHDTEKALAFARTLKPREIRITAAFGKRMDHTIANLQLLQPGPPEAILEFYDEYGRLAIISDQQEIKLPVGTTVSLFSFLPVYGVSLAGFQYPLADRDFPDGFTGLSNRTVLNVVDISVKRGYLMIYIVDGQTAD